MKDNILKLIFIAYRDYFKHSRKDKIELFQFAYVILFFLVFIAALIYEIIDWIF